MKIIKRKELLKMKNVFYTKIKENEKIDFTHPVYFKLDTIENCNDWFYIDFFDFKSDFIIEELMEEGVSLDFESYTSREGMFDNLDDLYIVSQGMDIYKMIDSMFEHIDFDKYCHYRKFKDF